jgi:7-cyano-7-deazaguanine synthase
MTSASTAVLLSGGLDSVVLAAHEAAAATVQPVYVSAGLAWEAEELAALDRLLARPPLTQRLAPLARLECPVQDLYPPSHWALRGDPPGFDTPDEDVYLTGRNIVLLSKAAIYCARHGLTRIVIGPLAGNPFPDATPAFFAAMGHALSLGLAHSIAIDAPFAGLRKEDVIRLGRALGVPLELTLSCMNPQGGRHCGRCSKCRERRDAFRSAGEEDRTTYVNTPIR